MGCRLPHRKKDILKLIILQVLVGKRFVKKKDAQLYLKNTYRVLLTRARQGFVIFIPEGCDADLTRQSSFYDGIYYYLKKIGMKEL